MKSAIFQFDSKQSFYRGKVRDVYKIGDRVAMVASDRISAFDHILPRTIPYKGQVLNQVAIHFLEATKDIVPNWLISSPFAHISVGHYCEPIKIEMVVRGYLAGHAWREYRDGKRQLCGSDMPDGLKEADKFPQPIITPATKADEGHDEDISPQAILNQGIVSSTQWNQLSSYALQLFQRGTEMARDRGLILVDTKYEFGLLDDNIILIDEIHTPDSSRYYIADGYEERQKQGTKQEQLSKEFVREWLMAHDFQGKEGQSMPVMPDDFVELVSNRYIELYEKITGKVFKKASIKIPQEEIERTVAEIL